MNIKKIMALVLAVMMVLGLTTAFAADHTITITRDSSYTENPNDNSTGTPTGNEKYTY